MSKSFRLALAQVNVTVGDLRGNTRKIIEGIGQAREWGADLVAFPELALPGYPPEDLLLNCAFVQDNLEALKKVTQATRGITAIVGFADMQDDIYNAAAILHDGKLAGVTFMRAVYGDASEEERKRIRSDLEQYCGQDTGGMVEIIKRLVDLAGEGLQNRLPL